MRFILFFLCLRVIFALLDPDTDPGTPLNPDLQNWNSYILFYIQARNISAQFEERHEAKTVGEMKLFVERLPQMQVSYRIVNLLCSFLSCRLAQDWAFARPYMLLQMQARCRPVAVCDIGCRNSLRYFVYLRGTAWRLLAFKMFSISHVKMIKVKHCWYCLPYFGSLNTFKF